VQLPAYLESQEALNAQGVDEVIVVAVNDPFVMGAWGRDQGIHGTMITFFADTRAELTRSTGLVLNEPKTMAALGNVRSKRFGAYVVDGIVQALNVCGDDDDPAGDEDPSAAQPDAMIEAIREANAR
jgi:peroxiredoxin